MSNGYGAPITDAVPMSRFNTQDPSNRYGYKTSLAGYKPPEAKIGNIATLNGAGTPNVNAAGFNLEQLSDAQLADLKIKLNPDSALGKFGGFMKGFGQAGQGLAALGSVYNAYNANKQAKKQFGFELAGMNRNLANDSLAYNSDLMQRTRDGAMLNGFRPGDEEFAKREEVARGRFADGSQLQA